MPRLTNRFNLPPQIVAYAESRPYSKGRANISITSLISSPQQVVLKDAHSSEIEVDVSNSVWSIFGSAVHDILAQRDAAGGVVEKRLYAEVDGWVISGQPDVVHEGEVTVIGDHKTSTVWNAMSPKPEWEAQLNGYDWLHRHVVRDSVYGEARLQINLLIRDWVASSVGRVKNYPESPILTLPITRWSEEGQDQFFYDRIALHQNAQADWAISGELPECSAEEMWASPDRWGVYSGTGKRPIKFFESKAEALDSGLMREGRWIEMRPGEFRKCDNWCEVSAFCNQKRKRDALQKSVDGATAGGKSAQAG